MASECYLSQHGASFIHHADVWEESLTIRIVIGKKFTSLSFGSYSLVVQCEHHWNSYLCIADFLCMFKHHCATNQISPESHSIPYIGKGKRSRLHMSQVAHQVGAYLRFCSMK